MGSEMCIRDRTGTVGTGRSAGESDEERQRVSGCAGESRGRMIKLFDGIKENRQNALHLDESYDKM